MAALCLNPTDATFSLKNVVLQKLAYPLVTTTFTHQQCQQIMAPLLQQGLSQAGVIHTYPQALIHGPLQYGGLDIPQLYTEQIIAHVQTVLRYSLDWEDPTGYLLHATGEAIWLEVGWQESHKDESLQTQCAFWFCLHFWPSLSSLLPKFVQKILWSLVICLKPIYHMDLVFIWGVSRLWYGPQTPRSESSNHGVQDKDQNKGIMFKSQDQNKGIMDCRPSK